MEYLSGFVAIMGSPNVGKSTLFNRMVGTKVSIVTHKPQTTRNKITGILTREQYQIVFLDTPGLHTPKNQLGDYMVTTAKHATKDVDVVLMVLDAKKGVLERDQAFIREFRSENFIAAINKTDAVSKDIVVFQQNQLKELGVNPAKIFPISALTGQGVEELQDAIVSMLPPGPQYFPADMVTDRPERFLAAELIREKALFHLREEIPHGVGVEIEKVEVSDDIVNISAVIYCERKTHKGMVIGKNGAMLKKIGSDARVDLEMLFGSQVYLELWVKVKEDWRNSNFMLKELGYKE